MADESRLGKALLKAGVITPPQLDEALRDQQREKISLIPLLVQKGWCRERDIVHALSVTLHIRTIDVKDALLSQKIVRMVPKSLANSHHVLPVLVQNNTLFVAMENPLDREVIHDIESHTNMQVTPVLATSSDLHDAIRRHYSMSEYVSTMLNHVEETEETKLAPSPKPPAAKPSQTPKAESDAKQKQSQIVRLWNMIFSEGIKARASDIHIEPGEQHVRVRYRIDGMLTRGINLPKEIYKPLLSRIKVLSGMDIMTRHSSQDGHIRVNYANRTVDLRVSTVVTNQGEQIVVRILDRTSRFYNITRLGLSAEQLTLYETFIEQTQGLILATGPTGSGKTTTLYALLHEMKDGARHIVTIEDPIEYQLEGISQIQVTPNTGMTFASGLRSILRQDPNVILVGEIRDAETASVAMQAAETGHLVLSTLHTTDAVSSIYRLATLGIPVDVIASNLLAAVGQRLVRRICPRCIKEYTPTQHELETLGLHGSQADFVFYHGEGCKACKNTGYYGQIGVFEMFIPTERLRNAIAKGANKQQLQRLAVESGMKTLFETGIEKVMQGMTSVEELLRVTSPKPKEAKKAPSKPIKPKPAAIVPPQAQEVAPPKPKEVAPEPAPTTLTCPQCHATLQPAWLICPMCGWLKREKPAKPEVTDFAELEEVTEVESQPQPVTSSQVDIPKWKERIVIAEDDPDASMMIKFFLQRQGYHVILANDGEEALEKIREERPDVVILDINMPKLDGFGVCKAMRAKVETMFTPVIMLTALSSIESKIQGLSLGADDYITKPFHPGELGARIEAILRRSYQHEVIQK
ncbi:type IV pilus assembly protein PilB [Candidatus Moduliflexus flocculans]|uniref:Type IV pilus assembly protein PilB n=1 Tax=Candidatus Moduliflexus flocculans TaxID=1499966 RepID=A0A0S6VSY2_9BACT|nr:type IV pilus assembly protein PilB [Candidatus Moduliflexus flocculans]